MIQVGLRAPSIIKPLVEVVTNGDEAVTCSSILDLIPFTFRNLEMPVAGVSKSKVNGMVESSGLVMVRVSTSLLVIRSPASWVFAMIWKLPAFAKLAVAVNTYVAEAFGAIGLVLNVSGVAAIGTPLTEKVTGTAACV